MGFDLTITLNVSIDPQTGLPYIYYVDNNRFLNKKPYVPQEHKIPDKYLRFIEQRGSIFHSYIKQFEENVHDTSVACFLEFYPEWEYVEKENGTEYEWCEKDHYEFKEALEWMCSVSPVPIFNVCWSY
jgi:hypothetical protein